MPSLSISPLRLVCGIIVLALAILLVSPPCPSDGVLAPFCALLDTLPAAMPASLISLSTAFLKRTAQHMPAASSRAFTTDNASFAYHIGAAAAGKRTSPRPPKLGRDYWHYTSVQENAKPPYLRSTKRDSGEDAFFAATVGGSKSHVAFGVADGVGGWQDQGIDPSEFSHGLCGLMAGTAYLHEGLKEGKNVRPRDLLQTAYDAVISNPRILAGGSTASLAVADDQGAIETANLGDSGFLIFGPGKVAHRSSAQTHAFNTPYQLAKIPARLQAQNAIFGGSAHFSETPSQADVEKHQLKHGDIVVFATDGVWDNLSAQDTLAIITNVMEEHGYWFKSHNFPGAETLLNETLVRALSEILNPENEQQYLPGLLATAVMREAKVAGLDQRREGPFAKEVKKMYPHEGWQGGKPDDIAVVVAVAVEGTETLDHQKPIKAKL
jgi:protein phosphatase PTC7